MNRRAWRSLVALHLGAAAIGVALLVVAVWLALRPAGTGPPSPPGPVPATGPASWSRTPVTFPAEINLVLSRAWTAGRYGCGITGPAIDGLAAALERDIAEAPPLDARVVASQWVAEHCREG